MLVNNDQNEEKAPLFTLEEGGDETRQNKSNNKYSKIAIVAFFALSIAGGVAAFFLKTTNADSSSSSYPKDKGNDFEFLPTHSEEVSEGTRIFARYNGDQGHNLARKCAKMILQDNDDDNVIIFEASDECLEELKQDNDIIDVEIDHEVFALGSSFISDPVAMERDLSEIIPWGLKAIQADQLEPGPSEIVVCVVDTGIALDHPDLNKARITGTDTTKFYGPVWSWNTNKGSHGTHVAGTIAALSDNDKGVRGAGSFRLHITRALDDNARGYESDIRTAVEQCVAAGANIINLSLGGAFMTPRSESYYTKVVEERGILMIAAAGNEGSDAKVYPAAHPSVISVGAVYEWGTRWQLSNFGDQLELAAPGHNIISTTVSAYSVTIADGFAHHASHITGSLDPLEPVAGELAFCETGDCKDSKKGICLMVKDTGTVQAMLQSCQNNGGIGAIIFHSTTDNSIQNWSAQGINIPAVAVRMTAGSSLMENVGETVTIGDTENDNIEYTYVNLHGTSMASPHVAAAAALVWSHYPNCSNHQIRYALTISAHNPQGNCDDHYGYGVVKAKDAYDWLSKNDCGDWDVPQLSQGGCTTLLE